LLAEILKHFDCVFVYGIASLKLKALLFDLHATDCFFKIKGLIVWPTCHWLLL